MEYRLKYKEFFITVIVLVCVGAIIGILFLMGVFGVNSKGAGVDSKRQESGGEQAGESVVSEASQIPLVDGINSAPAVSTAKECSTGNSDDYLHPERFINPDGTLKCADGVVIFDHHITPKFIRKIIPDVEEQTGKKIDLNQMDFYVTNMESGEEVVFTDVFNWYVNGNRTIFNTNQVLWDIWKDDLAGKRTVTFTVKLIHRPTGVNVSTLFKDHTTMTLLFVGLQ